MNDVKNSVAVQSWCFRAFKDNSQVIDLLKKADATGIELSGKHADFNDESTFESVISKYKSAGIQITSIGVQGYRGDEASFEKSCKFVKMAGAKRMAVSFAPEDHLTSIKMIEKYAEKYDILCGVHNHGGYDWLGSREILTYIFKHAGMRLGLELDTAWAMHAGEDPIQMAETFIDRLYGVHFKDFVFDRAGRGHDVIVGEGNLDLKKMVELVKNKAPAGCISVIEYEADVNNPGPAVARCVQAIKGVA